MLPRWDPTSLEKMLPCNCALIGSRRSGKSTLQTYLLKNHLAKHFDCIISFTGSVSCSDELRDFFVKRGKSHLMFDRLNSRFLETLQRQQEAQKIQTGKSRSVLLLLDDALMENSTIAELGIFTTRARHYNVSIMSCSVSFTSISKNFRRSLDVAFFFKLGMWSDKKLLLQEFTSSPQLVEYSHAELKEYECIVQEKNFRNGTFVFSINYDNASSHEDTLSFQDDSHSVSSLENQTQDFPIECDTLSEENKMDYSEKGESCEDS